YIPLPIIGSLYPLYRKWFGNVQDLSNPLYKFYSSSIQNLLNNYPGSIHVAGHEHALEYIVKDSASLIVSGAGSKTTFVRKKGYARYAESVNGFVRIYFSETGSAEEIQFIRVDDTIPNGVVTYTDTLEPVKKQEAFADTIRRDFSNQFVSVRASEQYQATPWRERMLGKNYRKEWHQLMNVPVFDMEHEKGGLKIVKKGGGMQTLSLRLADSTGHEFTLRSVEKFPQAAVPEMLRKTFAQDLVQDQISASHPYGALIIPPMAEAVGIYHTNPKLVFVPNDPNLGIYQNDFANTLCLFEERPDGDWSKNSFFGNSDNIINTSKVISKLKKNNNDHVDERFVLRSRLFDMVIGDWDRHDDQWRWATFDKKKGEDIFRPIPRDRDQAFFVNQGMLPKLWSRKWALPKFEGFQDKINWPSGLSFNARYFDRTFLTELTREDWIEEAKAIQSGLTDKVIEDAVSSWPEEISKLSGAEVIRKLKLRRDHLVEYAISHYEFLARSVDITGSDKDEIFRIKRMPSGDAHVKIYSVNKKGERDDKIYDRLFRYKETREIRLYGFGGKDEFDVTGEARRSIMVRIIGGDDIDTINDSSRVNSIVKRTLFYDSKKGSVIQPGAVEIRNMTSQKPEVNEYDRKAFQYNRLAPLLYGNYNVDDGLFIGGGFVYVSHGFRKTPFKQRHILLASIAPRTSSYNFLYRGDFTGVIGKWNLELNADLKVPNFVNNFFGWGNESVFDQHVDEQPDIRADKAIDYYRYRFEEIRLEAYLSRNIGTLAKFKIGPALQRIEIEEQSDEDRYVYDYAETLPYDLFTEFNSFTGVKWQFQLQKVDNPIAVRRGIRWNINGSSMKGIDKGSQDFNVFESDVSFYYTFQFPGRLTFALRTGGGINTGKYEFYQAQILDGKTEIRGFRKTRYYGDSKFYTNMEVRLKLSSFRTYLFPVSFGILGFHDIGRVWYKD
ncbi:MAG TPA: BamA/TamA family outer membrane protein, partial [Cyclobacteriaceae bacterium]|nr:BamA/TamA family outer membrane protein [Cyclobacteriaceae bacterium]